MIPIDHNDNRVLITNEEAEYQRKMYREACLADRSPHRKRMDALRERGDAAEKRITAARAAVNRTTVREYLEEACEMLAVWILERWATVTEAWAAWRRG